MLSVGSEFDSSLGCVSVGEWELGDTSTNIYEETGFNQNRFPKNATYKNPPNHYFDPSPKLTPYYPSGIISTRTKIQVPQQPLTHSSQNTIPAALTTTISSGTIHKASQNQRKNNNSYTPFSKIPRQPKNAGKISLSKSTSYIPPSTDNVFQAYPNSYPKFDDSISKKRFLQYTVTVSKRSNGNQPWEPSNVRPPMLGKMRRMTVQFAPFGPGPNYEVLFQCKDIKPKLHEGRLIVSPNDKGISRLNSSSSNLDIDETIFRTVLSASDITQAINVYLKPCWRGFGSNRERPEFSVTIAIRPAEKECAFVILHSWEVELHSHKMESSVKGKSMDANGPFEVRGSIPLDLINQLGDTDEGMTQGASNETPNISLLTVEQNPLPQKS